MSVVCEKIHHASVTEASLFPRHHSIAPLPSTLCDRLTFKMYSLSYKIMTQCIHQDLDATYRSERVTPKSARLDGNSLAQTSLCEKIIK